MKEWLGSEQLGSRIKYFSHFWEQITKDKYVLNTIQGLKLEFIHNKIPIQNRLLHIINMNKEESDFMRTKISQMIKNGTIREVPLHRIEIKNQWTSNVFL